MDDSRPWRQINIAFPDWDRAEQTALAHLAPKLLAAEGEGTIDDWFVIRKRPCWRVRFLPAADTDAPARIERQLDELAAGRHINGWTSGVYEPEIHAFGGAEAMAAAHRFFHRDSRGILAYLQDKGGAAGGHRREMSVMLCSILMRSAAQDWYEQGDIWARVAEHREPSGLPDRATPDTLHGAVHRLISVNAESQMREGGPLAYVADWANAYIAAGRELADLAAAGALHRGLRDVLAHHVVFAWNRIGLPYATQAVLATTAKVVVFGPDPTQGEKGEP